MPTIDIYGDQMPQRHLVSHLVSIPVFSQPAPFSWQFNPRGDLDIQDAEDLNDPYCGVLT